ncbi:hypothetical protein A1Q2_02831 [Trichosporon asahii var. asahii CBS 8904]|uniref:Short-chain dehydrogenase n=1 Tax=Trichosporon asahii var. asahii (strain CBS 8904) TaxID=1220162 RepID=K1VTH4_TRIAC|nr:hypothetical protein A1Q2_02831 [Trichosporon asahii var. asahii CBS 8904]
MPVDENDKSAGETELISQVQGGKLKVDNLFNVDGWVAVATLAENGARVYISGRRGEVLKKAAELGKPTSGKGEIIPVEADCSTKDGIQKLVKAVSAKEKQLNVLINNHGVSMPKPNINVEQTPEALSKEMFENEEMDRFLQTYQINTASYYFTAWAFLPLLSASKEPWGEPGSILNIASMSGITYTSQKGQFNYNASKAATISLTNQLACEFARRDLGVRVNSINPGYFPSGMTKFTTDSSDASEREYFRKTMGTPLARAGQATDHAQAVLAAVCNRFMTGCNLVVDGGWLLEQSLD